MSRPPSKPWLLPVASAIIGVAWVLWLARGEAPAVRAPAAPTPTAQSTAPARPGERSDKSVADAQPQVQRPAVPSAARPPEALQSPKEVPLQLVFEAPASARVGDSFDVRVAIVARNAIGRIVVEVAYDPAYLRVRTAEEIDYSGRTVAERAFSSQEMSDGNVELVLQKKRGEAALTLPASVPLVQFEAIAPGSAEIRIASISASDATDRPLTWSAAGRETQIVVN